MTGQQRAELWLGKLLSTRNWSQSDRQHHIVLFHISHAESVSIEKNGAREGEDLMQLPANFHVVFATMGHLPETYCFHDTTISSTTAQVVNLGVKHRTTGRGPAWCFYKSHPFLLIHIEDGHTHGLVQASVSVALVWVPGRVSVPADRDRDSQVLPAQQGVRPSPPVWWWVRGDGHLSPWSGSAPQCVRFCSHLTWFLLGISKVNEACCSSQCLQLISLTDTVGGRISSCLRRRQMRMTMTMPGVHRMAFGSSKGLIAKYKMMVMMMIVSLVTRDRLCSTAQKRIVVPQEPVGGWTSIDSVASLIDRKMILRLIQYHCYFIVKIFEILANSLHFTNSDFSEISFRRYLHARYTFWWKTEQATTIIKHVQTDRNHK